MGDFPPYPTGVGEIAEKCIGQQHVELWLARI
jgi:hypothetical protein